MHLDAFDYDLPAHLIAQEPCPQRDGARLLVVPRAGGPLAHQIFRDLPELLRSSDLLVHNDTRVIPARLVGRRERTGGKWEGLFLQERPDGTWELLCQTRGRLSVGETILVEGTSERNELRLRLIEKTATGRWLARSLLEGSALELVSRYGRVPLPPYIRKGQAGEPDRQRYQTIYAQRDGAVAAPTAGLHFTPEVFEALRQRGVERAFVTLHVGAGTFQPVQVEEVSQHRMQSEWAELPAPTVLAIEQCKARGGRVIAVGTTTVRVLESVAATGELRPWAGETDLTITPPYSFRAIDGLITNFHLPRSSLLLLVAAFLGLERMREVYRTAVEREYRFYSYGDAMLIL
jgi:S-adenosylmethionine:tRNA ribosyltransferase-isomerase